MAPQIMWSTAIYFDLQYGWSEGVSTFHLNIFRTKFFEFDLKPVCKFCYDRFPGELKKRLKKAYDEAAKK